MRTLAKKFQVALVISVILMSPILQAPITYSAEWSAPEKALSFLRDVIGFDLTRYKITLISSAKENRSDLAGILEERGKYALESDESKIEVIYTFWNRCLVYCNLYLLKGSPFYVHLQPVNLLDAAKDILVRYQAHSGDLSIQTMRGMLDNVTEIKSINITSYNVKLIVSGGSLSARFEWIYTCNGIDFTRKRRSIHFENGYLIAFSDLWNFYRVGSDKVNVSMDEAVAIARNATKEMPLLYGKVGGEIVSVQPKVADSPVEAKLMVGIKEPLTLYPLWHVQLYFDRVYGNYYGVAVDIWADTGEICGIYGTGIMGYIPLSENQQQTQAPAQTPSEEPPPPQEPPPTQTPPQEENPTPSPPEQTPPPTETQTNNQTNLNLTPFIIASAIPITATIIIATTLYKRKRKH